MECDYCQSNPPSIASDIFSNIYFLPSPMLDSGDKYKIFEDVYGTATTERDRPSLQATGDKQADEGTKHLLNASRVITCGECLKTRYVYSAAKLLSSEVVAVNQTKEDLYVCGSGFFPPDHSPSESIVVRQSITCQSPMETTYYSASTVDFPDVCFYCGQGDQNKLLSDEYIS